MKLFSLKKLPLIRTQNALTRRSDAFPKTKEQNNFSFTDWDPSEEQLYNELKSKIEGESKAKERYETTKKLYRQFPEQSLPFLTQRFLKDSIYHIKIVNFSERKRYNVNDLINTIITTKYDKEQMVQEIVENHLVPFLLSWKECTPFFQVSYDLHLHCFLLIQSGEKCCVYVCSRRKDPFSAIPVQKTLSMVPNSPLIRDLEVQKTLPPISYLSHIFEQVLEIKKAHLLLSMLITSPDTDLPRYKLSAKKEEIVLYF